jgi:chemotaxis protein MotB
MKKTFLFIALSSFIVGMFFTSCGPSKKLVNSQTRVGQLQKDSADQLGQLQRTQAQLEDCFVQVKNLNQSTASLQNDNALVLQDLKTLSSESQMTIAEQAERLKNLQDIILAQKEVMSKLKNSIADALMNYKSDELSIYMKEGNIYVSLQEKLLFKSGSAVVDPKGKEALKSLAQVLTNTEDISVMIEGHTDNVPIKTNSFKDNWDLSTARATSIVRILTKDNGFASDKISATGRGEFHPVATNDNIEGRAGNRRTEVILSPNLNELYKLLDQ